METLLDVWEGSLDIDETLLLSEGVKGLIIRLNDMNGGHHMDENFLSQWMQASSFLRAPYFVYNPWVDGLTNFNWMHDHLPSDGVTRVFADVEVRYTGYPAETYGQQLRKFIDKARQEYLITIYTGGWFLPIVTPWPTDVDYWWARYPYTFYPSQKQYWSWKQWYEVSGVYGWSPDPSKLCPSTIKLWQCSGDRLILPGCANRAIDMNLFNGNLASLEQWWGAEMPVTEDKLAILWREANIHGWNLSP